MDAVAAYSISTVNLVAVVRRHSDVMLRLVVQLARQIVGLQKVVEEVTSHRARQRLLNLLTLFALPTHDGVAVSRLSLGLTHEDMAKLIGTSRETVSRLLTEFEEEGLISREGRVLLVHASGPQSDPPAPDVLAGPVPLVL